MSEHLISSEVEILLHKMFGTNARNPHRKLCRDVLKVLAVSNPGIDFTSGEAIVDCEPARWIHWQTDAVRYSLYFAERHVNLTRRKAQWDSNRQRFKDDAALQKSFDPGSKTFWREIIEDLRATGLQVTVRGLSLVDHGIRLS